MGSVSEKAEAGAQDPRCAHHLEEGSAQPAGLNPEGPGETRAAAPALPTAATCQPRRPPRVLPTQVQQVRRAQRLLPRATSLTNDSPWGRGKAGDPAQRLRARIRSSRATGSGRQFPGWDTAGKANQGLSREGAGEGSGLPPETLMRPGLAELRREWSDCGWVRELVRVNSTLHKGTPNRRENSCVL